MPSLQFTSYTFQNSVLTNLLKGYISQTKTPKSKVFAQNCLSPKYVFRFLSVNHPKWLITTCKYHSVIQINKIVNLFN